MLGKLIRRLLGTPRRRPNRGRLRRERPTFEVLEMRLVMAATVTTPIADLTLATNQQTTYLDLLNHMADTRIHGTVTKWTTSMGTFYVDLFDSVTPMTVQNFLNYVDAGAYDSSLFHRLEPDFVLQGGGFQWTGTDDVAIQTSAPVPNEIENLRKAYPANTPINVRGTLAMAKMAAPADGGPFHGGPHSATSQWFFNLENNASNLDNQNGGFTTFGRVLGNGMNVIDTIASLPRHNSPNPLIGSAFPNVPLRNYTPGSQVTTGNLPLLQSIQVVPELNFTIVSNSNSGLVQASVDSAGRLTLQHQGNLTGSATITVRATDLFGGTAQDTFIVTYDNNGNRAPTVKSPLPDINLAEASEHRKRTTDLSTIFADADLGRGDRLTFHVVSNSNPRLVTTRFVGAELDTHIYAFENGEATITVRATDLSGAYVEDTYTVTVTAVNNPPQVLKSYPNRDVNEDSGSWTLYTSQIELFSDIDLWTNGDELTISVSHNSNPNVIATSVSGANVTFTPVPNANGYSTLRVRATDKAGAFAEVEFRITVHAVNDAPTFTIGSSHTSPAGGGLQTVPNFATNISPGPPNEAGQTLTFEIVNNTNPSMFKTLPSIAPNGTLTYELADNRLEVAQITVRLKDNGGTIRGGSDTSSPRTFLISAGNPWQNPNNRFDVDGSNRVDGFDLLILINELRNPLHSERGTHRLPVPRPTSGAPYLDIDGMMLNGSFYVNGFDVLELVNYLRSPIANQSTAPMASGLSAETSSPPSSNDLPAAESHFTAPLAAGLAADASFMFTTTSTAPQADAGLSESLASAPSYDARLLMGISLFMVEPFTGLASAVHEPLHDTESASSLAIHAEVFDDADLLQAISDDHAAWLNVQRPLSDDEPDELSTTAHDAVFTELDWK